MSAAPDIIVIGAGIVGAACALACAAGGLKVLVLEGGCIGGGVTAAGMGHLVVMDDSPAQLALTDYSCQLWRELAAELPPQAEYEPCGTLWVAADAQEMAEVERKRKLCADSGVAAEVWDARQLARAEPNLRQGLAGALHVSGDGVIYPPAAAAFLLAQAHGAQVRERTPVRRLLAEGGVELEGGERIAGAKVILATAAATDDLLHTLTPAAPQSTRLIRKRKGHLVITDRYPGYVHHQIVELGYLKSAHGGTADSVAFNIQPRKTGQMLIGSSRQYDAEGDDVDPAILAKMIRRAVEYLPTVGTLQAIRVWTGHRPATRDKLPLIGVSVESDRVYLATGHEGLGITTSLGTGRLIADMLLGRRPAIDVEPFAPGRVVKPEVAHG